ncbi:MAG TPA: hypothetical protein VGF16_16870 [Bryobacteraceae bacterium]
MDPHCETSEITRRRVLSLVTAAAAGCCRGWSQTESESSLQIDAARPAEAVAGERSLELRYRVDATVLLLSLPVFRRNAVGNARVAVREIPGRGTRRLAIEFAAGSDPSRAHGLDRRGWIREVIVERDGEPVSTAMLGLMSDSPEQSVEQARMAFAEQKPEPRFVAIDSSAVSGSTRSRVLHFQQPFSEDDSLDSVRRRFQASAPAWKETAWKGTGSQVPMPFLYALLRALERPGRVTQVLYVFNENQYRLQAESSADFERGRQFVAARLTESPDQVFRVRARIENLTRRTHPTQVHLWIDASASPPCPLRIEFEPRSFVRLTLERCTQVAGSSANEKI